MRMDAYSEVLETAESDEPGAGIVVFRHHGYKQDETKVFEGIRRVLVKKRPQRSGS